MTVGGRSVHLCARCTGQAVGALGFLGILFVSARLSLPLFALPAQLGFALAPLPAALDWLTQSVGRRESANNLRFFTGLLLGMAFADALALLLTGRWPLFLAAGLVFVLYAASISLVLRATGAWRQVLEEHFPGLEVGPIEPASGPPSP